MDKLENLAKINREKDIIINNLAEKVKALEDKLLAKEDTLNETEVIEEIEMNSTFFNSSVGIQCEHCEFIAKSKRGLQVHVKAKHNENNKIQEEPIENLDSGVPDEIEIENGLKCDQCELVTESEEDLKNHISLNHKKETEQTKIKLELFAIDVGIDVIEARQK